MDAFIPARRSSARLQTIPLAGLSRPDRPGRRSAAAPIPADIACTWASHRRVNSGHKCVSTRAPRMSQRVSLVENGGVANVVVLRRGAKRVLGESSVPAVDVRRMSVPRLLRRRVARTGAHAREERTSD